MIKYLKKEAKKHGLTIRQLIFCKILKEIIKFSICAFIGFLYAYIIIKFF